MSEGISIAELEKRARELRYRLVELSHRAKTVHLGSSLSCADIAIACYFTALRIDPNNPTDENRDRFILSKGHAATTLYSVLAAKGFFPEELLEQYSVPGSKLAEHPSAGCVPGIEVATGSLGHGLSLAVGLSLAGRLRGLDYRSFVVLSDGECNEGSVWEAAMFAPAQKIDNIVAIIDYNKWQATGRSQEVMALDPLVDKWRAFGWQTHEIDGHDMSALVEAMRSVPDGSGKPIAIVAHTVKGKGISFMEDDNNWHYRIPTEAEVRDAAVQLGVAA